MQAWPMNARHVRLRPTEVAAGQASDRCTRRLHVDLRARAGANARDYVRVRALFSARLLGLFIAATDNDDSDTLDGF